MSEHKPTVRTNPGASWPGIKALMAQEPRDYEKRPLTAQERADHEAYRYQDGWGRDTRFYGWTPEWQDRQDAADVDRYVEESFREYPDDAKQRWHYVMRRMRGTPDPEVVRSKVA